MSYTSIAQMAQDPALRDRVHACCAEQAVNWVSLVSADGLWSLAGSPGWAAAWDSAVAGNVQNPGANAGVITDGMLLSAVQPLKTKYPQS